MSKTDIKVAFTYVGAIVGAGFASGQELVKFFVVFSSYGLWGALGAGLLFSILGAMVIKVINKTKVSDYGELLKIIFPTYIYKFIEAIIGISLWLGLGIMLIGSSTLLNEQLNIPIIYGYLFTAILIFSSLFVGSKGLLYVNSVLVPILIIMAMGSSIIYIIKPVVCISENTQLKTLLPNWWFASILYVAYNMVLGIVVLASVEEKEKKTAWGGVIGGGILAIMAWVMVKGLLILPGNLLSVEMPMLLMTAKLHPYIYLMYTIALWIALFTTALANAHSLTTRLSSKARSTYRIKLAIILASTIGFIPWKFSFLIGLIYPILGYLGIPIIIGLVVSIWNSRCNM